MKQLDKLKTLISVAFGFVLAFATSASAQQRVVRPTAPAIATAATSSALPPMSAVESALSDCLRECFADRLTGSARRQMFCAVPANGSSVSSTARLVAETCLRSDTPICQAAHGIGSLSNAESLAALAQQHADRRCLSPQRVTVTVSATLNERPFAQTAAVPAPPPTVAAPAAAVAVRRVPSPVEQRRHREMATARRQSCSQEPESDRAACNACAERQGHLWLSFENDDSRRSFEQLYTRNGATYNSSMRCRPVTLVGVDTAIANIGTRLEQLNEENLSQRIRTEVANLGAGNIDLPALIGMLMIREQERDYAARLDRARGLYQACLGRHPNFVPSCTPPSWAETGFSDERRRNEGICVHGTRPVQHNLCDIQRGTYEDAREVYERFQRDSHTVLALNSSDDAGPTLVEYLSLCRGSNATASNTAQLCTQYQAHLRTVTSRFVNGDVPSHEQGAINAAVPATVPTAPIANTTPPSNEGDLISDVDTDDNGDPQHSARR